MTYLDYSSTDFYIAIKQILLNKGRIVTLNRGDCLCRIGNKCLTLGLLTSGTLKYSCPSSKGCERIISFAFPGDLVANYSSMRNNMPNLLDIVALEISTVIELPVSMVDVALGQDMRMRLGEVLSYRLLKETIDLCCRSTEERYVALTERFPDIHNRMTNRTIASYLGIAPESLCRLRKRLLMTRSDDSDMIYKKIILTA